jgi:hypothetical protein
MFKKKLQIFRVVYEFDGKVYAQTGTGAAIASLDADPYVTIISVEAI